MSNDPPCLANSLLPIYKIELQNKERNKQKSNQISILTTQKGRDNKSQPLGESSGFVIVRGSQCRNKKNRIKQLKIQTHALSVQVTNSLHSTPATSPCRANWTRNVAILAALLYSKKILSLSEHRKTLSHSVKQVYRASAVSKSAPKCLFSPKCM